MKEKLKKDYLNYLFFRTKKNLTRYQISADDSELIKKIFGKLIASENPHAALFILYNIKEFRNLSKYLIFILKKLEDDVVDFDNLLFNLENDTEFLQNEILSYLSNPERKIINEVIFEPEISGPDTVFSSNLINNRDEEKRRDDEFAETEKEPETQHETVTEEIEFRKNYLELIQTEEDETGIVYELPGMGTKGNKETMEPEMNSPELDLPEEEPANDKAEFKKEEEKISVDTDNDNEYENSNEKINPESSDNENEKGEDEVKDTETDEAFEIFETFGTEETEETVRIIGTIKTTEDTGDIETGETIGSGDITEEENISGFISEEELYVEQEKSIGGSKTEPDNTSEENDGEKIQLSEEIQGELDLFDEYGEAEDTEDTEESADAEKERSEREEEKLLKEIAETEPEPANTLFVEYESEIREKNRYLNREFDSMINLLAEKSKDEEERSRIIFSIIETSKHLEDLSRKMSLEVISNIYQTITLSFEKISEAKYDITESTLNLFKKGLTLVISLINGDNYFGYKDILKSIENIRNTLIEERHKRETYLKRLQEKLDMEKNLDKRFPDDTAKSKVALLKKYIRDTENNFKSLEKITGEYQIYEALRSLSGSLNNFKDIVKVSKELKMMKLVQLSEAGYIFVKFLQNYRINPVSDEMKEIFGYMIHNLKLLTMGRDTGDVDIFISYLNDPVKIFAKTEKKKN